MLLSEELALVAIDGGSGRPALGVRAELNASLAGLMVAELVIEGLATIGSDERQVVLTGPSPGSAALQAAVGVVADKGPRIKAVLSGMERGLQRQLGTGTWETAVAGLAAAGVVRAGDGGLRPKHEIVDPGVREEVIARLQAAARGESAGGNDRRIRALLSMSGPARLLEVVAPHRSGRREARQRIDHALDGTELAAIAKIVRTLIMENQSAAGAGAVIG
ncbi:MAG TPA: GPP34 family phosphoprotein [Acidimicrobiia bacterium]|nr:GPP34 family phosphoprotein [Acidimicrobiia bacterium]